MLKNTRKKAKPVPLLQVTLADWLPSEYLREPFLYPELSLDMLRLPLIMPLCSENWPGSSHVVGWVKVSHNGTLKAVGYSWDKSGMLQLAIEYVN